MLGIRPAFGGALTNVDDAFYLAEIVGIDFPVKNLFWLMMLHQKIY